MKLLLVTRRIPPARCGVGDYTARVAETLVRRGHDVCLATGKDQPSSLGDVPVWNAMSDFGGRGFSELIEKARAEKPDWIWFQWEPFLYHRRGWNLWPAFAASQAGRYGIRWQTTVHEPFVDWGWGKAGVLALGQRLTLAALILASDRVPVTVSAWADWIRRDFPGAGDKVVWAPVGSTIVPTGERAPRTERPRIGVFSPLGSGKDPAFVEAVWNRLGPLPAEFVLIGADKDKWPGRLAGDPRWRFTGELSEGEVSKEIASLDVFLAPFIDGISARRTSAIAAFAHGVPVVTNWGRLTDPIFTAPGADWLAPREAGAYAAAIRQLLASPEQRRMRAWIGQSLYEKYFEWDSVVARLLDEPIAAQTRKKA